ncbi:MAG: AsnC family protein, partial [Tepidimonas taiwanensis]|nr:AsnC family protein [Tepidimonas taiwanensis]
WRKVVAGFGAYLDEYPTQESPMPPSPSIDAVDRRILARLQEDGRITNRLAQIKCDACANSTRHDHILGDDKRRMECGHKRSMERSQ